MENGVNRVHANVNRLVDRQRLTEKEAATIKALVTGSVSKEAFRDADFVIEAVFEKLRQEASLG